MGVNRLIVLDTNPLRPRIGNGRIIKIVKVNFCVFEFFFLVEAMPEAPRSETLVAGLGSVLAILLTERTCVRVCRLCHGRSIQLYVYIYIYIYVLPWLQPKSSPAGAERCLD